MTRLPKNRVTGFVTCLLAALFSLLSMNAVHAQMFIANFGTGSIGEYNLDGSVVNASLVTGLHGPFGIAVSGSDIFVANENGTIGEYTTSGATVNAALISGSGTGPTSIAVYGSDIFVANRGDNTVAEYTTSGATVNSSLISGIGDFSIANFGSNLLIGGGNIGEYTTSGTAINSSLVSGRTSLTSSGIAVSGGDIFVTDYDTDVISEYTTSGTAVNLSLVTGLSQPSGIAAWGSDIFVVNEANGDTGLGTIGEYTTSGAVVNASLISGLSDPNGIAIESQAAAPEPSTWAMLLGGVGLLGFLRRRAFRS